MYERSDFGGGDLGVTPCQRHSGASWPHDTHRTGVDGARSSRGTRQMPAVWPHCGQVMAGVDIGESWEKRGDDGPAAVAPQENVRRASMQKRLLSSLFDGKEISDPASGFSPMETPEPHGSPISTERFAAARTTSKAQPSLKTRSQMQPSAGPGRRGVPQVSVAARQDRADDSARRVLPLRPVPARLARADPADRAGQTQGQLIADRFARGRPVEISAGEIGILHVSGLRGAFFVSP